MPDARLQRTRDVYAPSIDVIERDQWCANCDTVTGHDGRGCRPCRQRLLDAYPWREPMEPDTDTPWAV